MYTTRRTALHALAGGLLLTSLPPLRAAEPTLDAAVSAWAAGTTPRDGRVHIDVSELVENGNAVPVTLRVDSPMTPEQHVREIVLFNELNPQRDVARFQLSPANGAIDGQARVSTRIRLATTQQLAALARLSDGTVWQRRVEVIVTLAACVE